MAPPEAPASAEAIVRAAGSNLAFALAVLPRRTRRDMRVFYAFCRVVDDIADDEGTPVAERRAALDRWRGLLAGEIAPGPGIEAEMADLLLRRRLPVETLAEIIDGVAMDLDRDRYDSFADLLGYCHAVASAVGLVSIEIFGYREAGTRLYAEQLGYALQLTNILRDVGEDAARGRIYLPREDLARFSLTESDILARRHDDRFARLMAFEGERAETCYAAAVAALGRIDRPAMRSAELMRIIYSRLLARMKAGGYRVFERRYRLGRLEKLACLARVLAPI